jgi:uncharacterized protein (TIGR03118 family)
MRSSLALRQSSHCSRRWCGAVVFVVAFVMALASPPALAIPPGHYAERDLVSDVPGRAPVLDPNLVNPWGLAISPTGGAAWVANNGTDVATLYTGLVAGSPLVKAALEVSIPGAAPTGAVFNGTGGFVVTNGVSSASAIFLFASESGHISGWNPAVLPTTQARPAFTQAGAVYKGLALADTATGPRLYATDFANGEVDVLDTNFDLITLAGDFSDPAIPADFAPFGIRTVAGRIVVTYAKQDAAAEDDVPGAGNGFVAIYDLDGNLIDHFAEGEPLNSPWGIAQAPLSFGSASGALLIGNFGDGRIHAYDPESGRLLGALRGERGRKLSIDGLWGLDFGNGITVGSRETLLFTAGPDDEVHGLFGAITAVPSG